jgi:ribosome-associated protein
MEGGGTLDSLELAHRIVDLIMDKKAYDIVVLDLRKLFPLADYFVICTGDSEKQVEAIASEVREKLEAEGIEPLGVEGTPDSGWVLMDYRDVILHIFMPAQRDYYELEKLWRKAPVVVRIR